MEILKGYVKAVCANGQQIETNGPHYLRTIFLVGSNRITSNPPVGTKVTLEYKSDHRGGLWWGTVDKESQRKAEELPRFYSVTIESELYDAIEIHGVREHQDADTGTFTVEIADDAPEYFSVYLHGVDGEAQCVADFATMEQADFHAHALRDNYGWPIR